MYVCSVFPQAVKLFVTLYQEKKKKNGCILMAFLLIHLQDLDL